MKRNLFLGITCILLCFGCSEEDDSLSGSYRLTALSQSNCPNSAENFELSFIDESCDTAGGIEFCESGTINFSSDGNFTSTVRLNAPAFGDLFNLNGTGTYVANGNTVTLCSPDCSDFTLSGNKLIANEVTVGCDQRVEFTRN